jgi:hypothetical protein
MMPGNPLTAIIRGELVRTIWTLWVFILFCFLTGTAASADISEPPLVIRLATGTIDWRKGFVEAKGTAMQPKSVQARKKQQGRAAAVTVARDVAGRNLFSTLQEIRINADTKLSDVIINNEDITNRLHAMVSEAAITRQKNLPGGTVEVTLRMNLYGAFAHLMLPPEIRQIETVRPIPADKKPDNASSQGESERIYKPKSFTGMVVDARGTGFTPAMAPRIVDENGEEVFGPAFASREFAVQSGMVGYAFEMAKALKNPRVTDHPMTLKGLNTKSLGNCDIVVSISDANRLRSNFNNLSFLKKCRVMIVLGTIGNKNRK